MVSELQPERVKVGQTTPFDFVNDICYGKKDLYNEETKKGYIPFIVNRALSYFPDTVLYANDMNLFPAIDKYAQYQYFLFAIPKRKRFAKWGKKINNQDIVSVSNVYRCNHVRAAEILEVLSDDQLKIIRDMSDALEQT